MMKLKDEPDLGVTKARQLRSRRASNVETIQLDLTTIRHVQTADEVKQR